MPLPEFGGCLKQFLGGKEGHGPSQSKESAKKSEEDETGK
jgi:hypothetical protein